jgi:glycosyltransferase involved in cell wall biosynthesis
VLGVGDLRAKKNFGLLVEAMRRLDVPHRLILAGIESGQGAALAGDRVELAGYVSDARLDALMRGASALVHPSLYEGFGLVVLEAMSRGTPVLAAGVTALPETGGDAAAYFDPSDPDDLGRRLLALIEDPERRDELSRRGREWAAGFSWARTAAETAAVYRELL